MRERVQLRARASAPPAVARESGAPGLLLFAAQGAGRVVRAGDDFGDSLGEPAAGAIGRLLLGIGGIAGPGAIADRPAAEVHTGLAAGVKLAHGEVDDSHQEDGQDQDSKENSIHGCHQHSCGRRRRVGNSLSQATFYGILRGSRDIGSFQASGSAKQEHSMADEVDLKQLLATMQARMDAQPGGFTATKLDPEELAQAIAHPLAAREIQRGMKLEATSVQEGDPAFDFELPRLLDSPGMSESVSLSEHFGKRPVALIFGSYT